MTYTLLFDNVVYLCVIVLLFQFPSYCIVDMTYSLNSCTRTHHQSINQTNQTLYLRLSYNLLPPLPPMLPPSDQCQLSPFLVTLFTNQSTNLDGRHGRYVNIIHGN
jgi:hypothetical protein